jgi:hypothetical protein
LIKFRLPAQVVEQPVLPHPTLLVLIEFIAAVAGSAIAADDLYHEVSRAIQICVSETVEVLAGDEDNIGLTPREVGADFHLKGCCNYRA